MKGLEFSHGVMMIRKAFGIVSLGWSGGLACLAGMFIAALTSLPSQAQDSTAAVVTTSSPEATAEHVVAQGVVYAPDKLVEGELAIVGSTTMQQLAVLWTEEFRQIHPGTRVTIDCRGSEETFPALSKAKTTIGLLSRELTAKDMEKWQHDLETQILPITVGYDILALIVHPQNPVRGLAWNPRKESPLSLQDDSLVTRWQQLGITGPLAESELSCHVLTKQHGLRSYSDKILLGKPAETPLKASEHETQLDIMKAVAGDISGVAIVSGSRGLPAKVKAVPISRATGEFISPTAGDAIDRGYPMVRPLQILVLSRDNSREPLVEEFITYVLSRMGQQELIKDGFVPLDASQLRAQEEKLGWNPLK